VASGYGQHVPYLFQLHKLSSAGGCIQHHSTKPRTKCITCKLWLQVCLFICPVEDVGTTSCVFVDVFVFMCIIVCPVPLITNLPCYVSYCLVFEGCLSLGSEILHNNKKCGSEFIILNKGIVVGQ
jgi:hypothetical protein